MQNKKASNCAFGLDIMWLLIQEDAGVPPAVSTAALEYFFKLLKVNAAVRCVSSDIGVGNPACAGRVDGEGRKSADMFG